MTEIAKYCQKEEVIVKDKDKSLDPTVIPYHYAYQIDKPALLRIKSIVDPKAANDFNCEQILAQLAQNKESTSLTPVKNERKNSHKEQSELIQYNSPMPSPRHNVSFKEKLLQVKTTFCEHIITPEEEKNIKEALSQHFVFKEITNDVYMKVLKKLLHYVFKKGQLIYEEGDEGNFFFILSNGRIEASAKGKPSKIYSKWNCFGELSLIAKCKREETLKCLSQVSLFCLDGESFRNIQTSLNEARLRERYNFLNTISIFQTLESIAKYNVTDRLKLRDFGMDERIISCGDIGNTLYIIKSGVVSCRMGNVQVRKLTQSDYFGQNAILIDAKRKCDVVAVEPTRCFELSRCDLIEALGVDYINIILFSFFVNSVKNNAYLRDVFIESKHRELFAVFKIRTYSMNDFIASRLEKTNKRLLIVIDGSLYKEANHIFAEKGNIIGEDIFKNHKLDLPPSVFANPDCIALEAEIDELARILHINLTVEKPMNLLSRISKLKKQFLFQNLSEQTIESLALRMNKEKYSAGDVVVQEDSFGDKFYLIAKGRVRITVKNKVLRDLENGSCFGEIALLVRDEKRTATVSALESVSLYAISKGDFDLILQSTEIKECLRKKLALQDTSLELKDLNYIKFLGKGKFGNVSLVHNRKNIYAIKSVSRRSVDKQKILARYFVNERRVMLSLDHPFIVKMVKTLKNGAYCFFLMEFVNGKNLDEYLVDRPNKRNTQETQFFMASILLMLEYLQKKLIAHRDIKPSNIMIDANGYLKMIDFGTAKVLTDYTYTIIGTPHYIAPEILNGKGYSLSCDFWSIGICMFEIFYGVLPFGQYANDVMEIYKDILHKDYSFPSDSPKYYRCHQLIKSLLMKKVNQRECNVALLKSKEFFSELDWSSLIDFKLTPPFIPQISKYNNLLNEINSFSELMKDEGASTSIKEKAEEEAANYDQHWVDEF